MRHKLVKEYHSLCEKLCAHPCMQPYVTDAKLQKKEFIYGTAVANMIQTVTKHMLMQLQDICNKSAACLGGRLPPAPHLLRLRPPRAWGSRWIISRRRAAGLGYTSWPPHGHHGRSVFDRPVTHLNDVSRAGHIESNDEVSWITAQAARPWLIREPRAVRCPDKEAHRGVESRSNRQAVHQVRGVLCEVYS
jgi:hypothetical protein